MKKRVLIIAALFLSLIFSSFGASESISLDGVWRFQMDPKGEGRSQQWNLAKLSDTISLPGTMSQNEKGFRNEDRNQTNYLSRPFTFKGKAWYQREIEIPAEWASRRVSLHLERTKLTSVWLDENFIGHQDGLGSEQVYQLSDHLSAGSHVLTICVDKQVIA